jgi:hypothetical protein
MTKYRNRKTEFAGLTFDSAAEARRYGELVILERVGKIEKLQRQVPIVLVPGAKLHGAARARPAIRLVVDFAYVESGAQVFEDTKGFETPASLIKRHLAKALHGIDVRLTA